MNATVCSDPILPGQLVTVRREATRHGERLVPGAKGVVRRAHEGWLDVLFDWDTHSFHRGDLAHWGGCPAVARVGERVRVAAAMKRPVVDAGSPGTVTDIEPIQGWVTVRLDDGREVSDRRARFVPA